jgi:hypothetical protein
MVKCPACGELNPDKSSSCKSCAAPLPHGEIYQVKPGLKYRNLLIIGLRLLGIYLLVFGVLGLLNKISSAFVLDYFVSMEMEIPVTSNLFQKIHLLGISSGAIWQLIRIFVGLYFCKGGDMIIRFLVGKDKFLSA